MEIVVQSMKILKALNVYFLDDWHDMLIISQYNLFFFLKVFFFLCSAGESSQGLVHGVMG